MARRAAPRARPVPPGRGGVLRARAGARPGRLHPASRDRGARRAGAGARSAGGGHGPRPLHRLGRGGVRAGRAAARLDGLGRRAGRAAAALRPGERAARSVSRGASGCARAISSSRSRGSVPAGAADLVVANPPYLATPILPALPVEVRDWEPREALDGGPDGLAVIRRLLAEAPEWLRAGGALLAEIGEDQGPTALALVAAAGAVRGGGASCTGTSVDASACSRRGGARWRPGSSSRAASPFAARFVSARRRTRPCRSWRRRSSRRSPSCSRTSPAWRTSRPSGPCSRASAPRSRTVTARRSRGRPRSGPSRRRTSWSRPCGRPSWCSGRSWPEPAAPASRCPAAARSGRGRSTSTSRGSSASAPRSRSPRATWRPGPRG